MFITMEEKSFVNWQIQCRFGANFILENRATARKPTMMQKEIITFNPIYLTKLNSISSILNFLNTESLVAQVSKTRFNIQSVQLYTFEPNRSSSN